ncbi:hypothetical protein EI94DRAFT_1750415 [Lactarius quietus]|nr:hypothetical protein EI94DRAFT_1750415 [Lactarius quietus]
MSSKLPHTNQTCKPMTPFHSVSTSRPTAAYPYAAEQFLPLSSGRNCMDTGAHRVPCLRVTRLRIAVHMRGNTPSPTVVRSVACRADPRWKTPAPPRTLPRADAVCTGDQRNWRLRLRGESQPSRRESWRRGREHGSTLSRVGWVQVGCSIRVLLHRLHRPQWENGLAQAQLDSTPSCRLQLGDSSPA